MPVVARELSGPEVSAISVPGTHAVGGVTGLCLQVTGTGARSWLLRITVDQKRREFGLGAFPTVSVQVARTAARALRQKIGQGADPALQRRATRAARRIATSKSVTFKACAEAFLAAELASGRDARYVGVALRDLERLAFPQLGQSTIASVTTESVLGVLAPIWTVKPTVATKLRGTIERVLDYAEARGFRDGRNPARWRGHMDGLLPSPASLRQHERHASLPADQVPDFFAELSQMPGVASVALQFLVLMAAKPKDVREMRWSDIDLGSATWRPPVEGSKIQPTFWIPLPKPAMRLLAALPPMGPQSPVFTSPRGGHALSDMTLTAVVRRMNDRRCAGGMKPWIDAACGDRDVVPAGFRATFRSWAEQTPEYLEGAVNFLSLSTANGATAGAHVTGASSAKRALEAWAQYCRKATEP